MVPGIPPRLWHKRTMQVHSLGSPSSPQRAGRMYRCSHDAVSSGKVVPGWRGRKDEVPP